MDDIDAVAPRRTKNSSQHQNRVVAQLLTLMDGTKQWGQSPVVVATTTRPNTIDPALRRPGRFDREIETSLPNTSERSLILRVHLRNVPIDDTETTDFEPTLIRSRKTRKATGCRFTMSLPRSRYGCGEAVCTEYPKRQ